jgi:hypothetical protein
MGAYKYVGELYKKKQSDVLRFLLRVRSVYELPSCAAQLISSWSFGVEDAGNIAS